MALHFPDLPYKQTLIFFFLELKHSGLRVLKISVLPFLLSLGAFYLPDFLLTLQYSHSASTFNRFFFSFVTGLVIYPFTALLLFRSFLLGDTNFLITLTRNGILRYFQLIKFIGLYLLGCAALFVLFGIFWVIAWHSLTQAQPWIVRLYVIACIFWLSRMYFVFPALAVDAQYSLHDALQATQGVSFRVFALCFTMIIPPWLLLVYLRTLFDTTWPLYEITAGEYELFQLNTSYYIWAIIGNILNMLWLIGIVITASVSFYLRTGWHPGAHRDLNNQTLQQKSYNSVSARYGNGRL